jgi:hypothetical protein
MATVFKLLRSTVPGRVPTAAQVAQGSLAINLADRRLFSKDHNNEVFRIARPRDPSDYQLLHATDGTTLYMGRLAWADYPATGPAEDAPSWTIYKITTNAAGDVVSEQSAVGAWSSKESLQFS